MNATRKELETPYNPERHRLMPARMRTGIIRHHIFFPAVKPEQVYRALLSTTEHSEFTGAPAKCSARIGGRFTAWDEYISGKNLELISDKKIVQEWKTTEWPDKYPPSILKITLTEKTTGTELTMVQSKVPSSQVNDYDKGWYDAYWNPMKEYFSKKGK